MTCDRQRKADVTSLLQQRSYQFLSLNRQNIKHEREWGFDGFTKVAMEKMVFKPAPAQKGVQIEIWSDKLTVLIQKPGINEDQLRAFNKGFRQYLYLESDTPIPIAFWIFDFPEPFGPVEGSCNVKLSQREWVELYLDTSDESVIKNTIQFFLLDGQVLKAIKSVEIDPVAVKLFHDTIRKQLELNYDQTTFDRYFAGLHNYDMQELSSIGRVFKQKLRPDSLTSKFLLCLRKWL